MKKITIVIMVLTIITILTSCSQPNIDNPHQGKEGMEMEFLKNTLDVIPEDSQLQIGIHVMNKGATNISESKAIIITERTMFDNFDNVFNPQLYGKSIDMRQGEEDIFYIDLQSKKIISASEKETEVRVKYCYPYQTTFSSPVCIDTDINNEKEYKPDICPPSTLSPWGGQGAPVAITKIIPKMIPTKDGIIPEFTIEIENVNNGWVVATNEYDTACSQEGVSHENIGLIDTSNVFLGHDRLECTRSQLRVREKEDNEYYDSQTATIKCSGDLVAYEVQPYIGSLTLTLNYAYVEEISMPVTIEKDIQ